MSDLDPFVLAVFGPPPPGIDLSEETETRNNIITSVFLALAILSVVARWLARRISGAGLQADDYVIFVSLILCIATAILNIMFGPAGSGHHVWTLTPAILRSGFKISIAYTFVWALVVSATKISIILLYRRIFAFQHPSFRLWLNVLVAVVVCQTLAVTVSNFTVCRPLSYLWNRFSPGTHGTCFDQPLFLLATGVINAVLDIVILITPIPQIWKLKLSTKKKVGVCAMMLLGCLVCVASWIRVYYLSEARRTIDSTWVAGETATWSSIESSLGIVSACLPVLRPLFSKMHKGFGFSTVSRSVFSSNPKGTYGDSTGETPSHGRSLGSDWQGGAIRRGNQPSEDAIELTNIISRGASGDVSCTDADRIIVRSEVKQAHSYV